MQLVTLGCTVNFIMKDGAVRPLIVTNVFPGDAPDKAMVNGHLLLDGSNDRGNNPMGVELKEGEADPMTHWITSARHDFEKAVGTWHWPLR